MEGGHTQQIPSLKLTNRTWKSLVGRWMSFLDKMHKSNCRYFVLVCGFGPRCDHGAAGLCIQARWLTTPAGCRCRGSWVACQLHYFCFHKLREAKRRQSRSRGLSDGGILLEPGCSFCWRFLSGSDGSRFFWDLGRYGHCGVSTWVVWMWPNSRWKAPSPWHRADAKAISSCPSLGHMEWREKVTHVGRRSRIAVASSPWW